MTEVLKAALDYAARGWQVFPIKPQSKEPATRRGFYDATTNPATLRRWFARGHPYNIAVRTGLISGIFILDIDGEVGATNLCALVAEHGAIPQTRISTTGKGHHLWFRAETDIPCSTGKIAPGVDIRADSGYVVAPPSVHPSGAIYRWANDLAPATAPDWLIRAAQQPKPISETAAAVQPSVSKTAAVGVGAYGQAALDREIDALSKAPKGSRNAALNVVTFRLYQLVAGGELEGGEVQQGLIAATHANGLWTDPQDGPRRVIATIRSGARAGMRFPRNRRGRQ
jgi:hypothetical protein